MGLQKQSKDPEVVEVEASSAEATPSSKEEHKFRSLRKRIDPAVCCNVCMKISFVMLGIVAILLAFAMITITVLTSIATKAYDTHQSSRLVAMVLLAVTAAISACIIISAEVAVFKKHVKPIHAAGMVLLVLAVIQAMIAGISVKVTASDELNLGKSLADSFKLSRTDNPRHVKLWATTQLDLNCCGVYGPEDYRSKNLPYYFPPDVPVSCCPAYDPDRSDLVQEKERETCKAKKTFYDTGCKDLVLTVFKETSSMVLGVTLTLIIVELLLMIFGALLCKQMNKKPKESVEGEQ